MRAIAIALALTAMTCPVMAAAQVTDPAAPAPTPSPAPLAPVLAPNAGALVAEQVLTDRDVPPPAGRPGILKPGFTFDIETSEDGSTVSAQLSGGSIRQRGRNVDGQPKHKPFGSNWLVKVTVPIEGLEALQKPGATLDLLQNGTKINFSYSFLRFGGAGETLSGGPFLTQIMPAARKACKERVDLAAARAEDHLKYCDSVWPDPEFARGYLGEAAVNESLYGGGMWQGGIEGALSVARFDYIDPTTLATLSPEKTSGSVSGFLSYYPSDAMSMWGARAEYQNGFKAGETQAICKPVVVDPAVDCVSGLPAPVHTERLNVSFEYRRVIDTGLDVGDFAISPRVTYDTLSNEAIAEFPVYFLPAKAGPFSPGVTATYSTKTEELSLTFFVRTSFTF